MNVDDIINEIQDRIDFLEAESKNASTFSIAYYSAGIFELKNLLTKIAESYFEKDNGYAYQ